MQDIIAILAHLSLLVHVGKDVQSIAMELIKHAENFPSTGEMLELVDDAISLVKTNLLKLSADVQQQFLDALNQLKNDLEAGTVSVAPQTHS